MSDLAELIRAERSAADLNADYDGSVDTYGDYQNAKAATDAAIAELTAQVVPQPNQDAVYAIYNRAYDIEFRESAKAGSHCVKAGVDAVISHLSALTRPDTPVPTERTTRLGDIPTAWRAAKADALREAAGAVESEPTSDPGTAWANKDSADWLRARADSIEQEGADRG